MYKEPKEPAAIEKKEARGQDIAESLKKYNEVVHQRRESLPAEQQVYRDKVVSTFLKAVVLLSKIDKF